jgi:hypothetical protein
MNSLTLKSARFRAESTTRRERSDCHQSPEWEKCIGTFYRIPRAIWPSQLLKNGSFYLSNSLLRHLNSSLTKAINHLETGITVELPFEPEQKATYTRVHNTPGLKPWLENSFGINVEMGLTSTKLCGTKQGPWMTRSQHGKRNMNRDQGVSPDEGAASWQYWVRDYSRGYNDGFMEALRSKRSWMRCMKKRIVSCETSKGFLRCQSRHCEFIVRIYDNRYQRQ